MAFGARTRVPRWTALVEAVKNREPGGAAWAARSSAVSSSTCFWSPSRRSSSSRIRWTPLRLMPSSCDRYWTSRSRATSRSEYRRPRPRVRVGTTRPSRSYVRRVCGCMPARRAAVEIGNRAASRSSRSGRCSMSTPHQMRSGVRLGREPLVLGQRRLRLLREVLRHLNFDRDEHVAGIARFAHATALDPERTAVRRSRGNAQPDRTVGERRYVYLRAERCFAVRHGHGHRERVAVAAEDRVRRDVHRHVQVACSATVLAHAALALDADPLAVVDARRDPYLHRPRRPGTTRTRAHRARGLDDEAAAPALSARLADREPARLRRLHA